MPPHDSREYPQPQPEPSPPTGEEECAGLRSDLNGVTEEVRRLIGSVSDDTLNRRPGEERWSAGECIDHLVVIGELLLPRIDEAIRSGRENRWFATGPFRYSWPGRMFIESLQPGSRLRIKTQREYVPARFHSQPELLRRFTAMQEGLIRSVAEASGLDLVRIKVASPASRLIRFSLGVWFASTVAHERRHCAQAARVLSEKENA